jgi:hypothetical protein
MSALWHDIDYIPDKSIQVPTVQKQLDEAPLPSEEHQLPKGWDAFSKMDEIYEVAGEQMDRGLDAQNFLYGKKAPAAVAAGDIRTKDAPAPDELTKTMVAQRHMVQDMDPNVDVRAVQDVKHTDEQLIKRQEAGTQPSKVSNATEASNARQDSARQVKALEMAEGIGVMMASVAAGQAMDPASGSIAAEAASVVKAVSTAKSAVGMTKSMGETPETSRSEFLRRGIRADRSVKHQPSLEPAPDTEHQPSLDPGDPNATKKG